MERALLERAPMKPSHVFLASSLLLVLASACGGSTAPTVSSGDATDAKEEATGGSQPGTSTSPSPGAVIGSPNCGDEEPFDPGPTLDVSKADEVVAKILALKEAKFASTKSDFGVALKPTDNLHATATIRFEISPLKEGTTEHCTGPSAPNCTETWTFDGEVNRTWRAPLVGGDQPNALLPGVTCLNRECSSIQIDAGTTIRFQRIDDQYPFGGEFHHFVRVVRPSTTSCTTGEMRCRSSTMCLALDAYCTLCEGGPADKCACRTGCDVKAAGTQCAYDTSDDTIHAGTCSAEAVCK